MFLITPLLRAQVGINTSTPSADLDVVGDVKVDDKIYLENPGNRILSSGVTLLVSTTSGNIKKYDINTAKYGPINTVQYRFRVTSNFGLFDFDTKIPTDEYITTVQGYFFQKPAPFASTNVLLHSNNDDDNIEGHQVFAFKNTTTNTWILRVYAANSEFRTQTDGATGLYFDSTVDIYLNVIIYRTDFIAKELPDRTVNMGNSSTATATLPTGY